MSKETLANKLRKRYNFAVTTAPIKLVRSVKKITCCLTTKLLVKALKVLPIVPLTVLCPARHVKMDIISTVIHLFKIFKTFQLRLREIE